MFQLFLVVFSFAFIAKQCVSLYKGQNVVGDHEQQMEKKTVFLLSVYAVLYLVFSVFEVAIRVHQNLSDDYQLANWIVFAIVTLIAILFLPVAYLAVLYNKRDFCAPESLEKGG